MKKLTLLAIIIVITLAGCGGESIDRDDANTAVIAILKGDVETANQYVCPDQQLDPTEATPPEDLEEDLDIRSACQPGDDTVTCLVEITRDGETSSGILEFEVEDGKLCTVLQN